MRLWKMLAVSAVLTAWMFPVSIDAQVTVEVTLATDIVDRMPQGTGTSFPADVGSLSLWTQVTGAEGSTLQHVWLHGEMEFPVSLEIGGSPWRTWSSKTIPPEWAGEWRVEVRAADGEVLETVSFMVGS